MTTNYLLNLETREFVNVTLPEGFSVYCVKCNGMLPPGTATRRYDGATYSHTSCPKTPLKQFAPHKYGPVR